MIKNRFWDAEEDLIGTFKKCGPDGAIGLANVLKTLHDPKSPNFRPDDGRSITLLKAIGEMGAQANSVVPLLMDLLQERDSLRPQILNALGSIGPAASAAIPAVVALLKDAPLAEPARIALRRMGMVDIDMLEKMGSPSKESVPMLGRLADKSFPPAVRARAVKLLGEVGKPAVPAFKELLKNADTLDTIALIQAIATLGPDARPLLPQLQEIMIKNRFWDAQEELIVTFKKCGPDGASGLATVLKTFQDPKSPHFAPDDDRSKTLLKALGEMGAEAKSAVPVLIDLLRERDSLRPQVLDALGAIGPAANAAIPAVEALLQDGALAEQARTALRRMGVTDKK
jgi:hypothetical protein